MSLKPPVTPAHAWPSALWNLWLEGDRRCTVWMHHAGASAWVVWPLVVVSRMGNGLLWYSLIALLPVLDRQAGGRHALQMLALGLLNLAVYLWLKPRIGRLRPFESCPGVKARTRALDPFSFPSGHTLHAVAFSLVLAHHYPVWSALLWLFCGLVALSRVVLGLHYPSDVIFAGGLALLTGHLVLSFV